MTVTKAVVLLQKFCFGLENSLQIYKPHVDLLERDTCIKGLFWPPLEPKTENFFSPISFDWFIRRIIEV